MSLLEDLFGAGLIPRTDFPPQSRYNGSDVRALTMVDGRVIAYLARRFVPSPADFVTVSVYRVAEGDRLDRIAASLTGNPEQYWMLCDANGAIWPEELEVPEAAVRVTMPAGLGAPGEGL